MMFQTIYFLKAYDPLSIDPPNHTSNTLLLIAHFPLAITECPIFNSQSFSLGSEVKCGSMIQNLQNVQNFK